MTASGLKSIEYFTGEYRFLSNFYPSTIRYEQILYPTVEHAFQAAKAPTVEGKRLIASASSAGRAKQLGRQVRLPKTWESIKVGIMRDLVRLKFTKHCDLRELLLATGDIPLVEGNTWGDRFWGVCGGFGKNHLGQILMEIRGGLFIARSVCMFLCSCSLERRNC